jgi:hypothetical protein
VSSLRVFASDNTITHLSSRGDVLPAKHQAFPIGWHILQKRRRICGECVPKLRIVLHDEHPLHAVHQGVLENSEVRLLATVCTAARPPLAGAWDSVAVYGIKRLRLCERPAALGDP